MELLERIKLKDSKIAVIGLGYVGLPLALEFAKHFSVIGYDINSSRVGLMQNAVDPSNELESDAFEGADIEFSAHAEILNKANCFIIGVPTDIDEHKQPNLSPLKAASKDVGNAIHKGDCVVFESTVYPGCIEEECIPIIEEVSGLKRDVDFSFGYSPERINPGDRERTLTKILKVVAGHNADSTKMIAELYNTIIEAGIFEAESIKVAEAAKVIENTQRDINIALMNELAMIFDSMNIDTKSVLKAAGTKWNFLKFHPGLVGGHCIGVDPYYLTYKAKQFGYHPKMILSGREINEQMPSFIAKRLVKILLNKGKDINKCKVLVMGITFKENVTDIRNSKVVNLIQELKDYNLKVDVVDPLAQQEEVKEEYQLDLMKNHSDDYDAIIVAVSHNEYLHLDESFFLNHSSDHPIIFDLKGIYNRKAFTKINYWRL